MELSTLLKKPTLSAYKVSLGLLAFALTTTISLGECHAQSLRVNHAGKAGPSAGKSLDGDLLR
jgi:hypothetical protein